MDISEGTFADDTVTSDYKSIAEKLKGLEWGIEKPDDIKQKQNQNKRHGNGRKK